MQKIPQIPKRIGNPPKGNVKHHLPVPRTPKKIDEVRHQVKLYALMENIDQYKNDKAELIDIIRTINLSRKAKLVTPQLLAILGIENKSDPNAFTCSELVDIIIYLYEAVIAREKMFVGSTTFEQWYDLTLHVLHYYNPEAPRLKDGTSPTYCHTISKGFDDKAKAEAMVAFLYTTIAMEQYGIKAIGYRTEGFHTTKPIEIKIWCNSAKHLAQNELINLLAGEEEGKR